MVAASVLDGTSQGIRGTRIVKELFSPGGDRSRQRSSSEVKRAEEGNDDLVNHPLQKIKCRQQSRRVRPRRLSE